MKPYLIGVAGPSGSGKSELASFIAKQLDSPSSVLSLDSYYLPMDHLPLEQRELVNFDRPEALDWELIRAHIEKLKAGEAVDEPVYRFDLHTRAFEVRRIEPARALAVEGLFALHDPAVRSLLDLAIYVETNENVCLARRLARDVIERGRTPESVVAQYEATVRPMARRFVFPAKAHADIVVSGEQPLELSWAMIEPMLPGGLLSAGTPKPEAAHIPLESA